MIEKTEAAPLLRPVITEKGLAAANQAATLGKPAVISHVAVSATPGEAKPTDETLPGAGEKMPIDDGRVVVDGQVNISMLLRDTYPTTDICGLAFYLADGTMFATYRTTEPFLYHKQGETLLVGMDFVMGNIPSDSIIVESTGANLVFGDWVPETRRINGKNLKADVMLNAVDVNAAPSGFGLGEEQAFTVPDLDTDPMTWNGGKMGWVRGISSTLNKPFNATGTAIFQRYQRGDVSAGNLLYFAGDRLFTRRWSGSAWRDWSELYSTSFKPTPADIGAVATVDLVGLAIGKPKDLAKENLNDLGAGVYKQQLNANTSAELNYPENQAGALTCYETASSRLVQEYRPYNANKTYTRIKSSSAWGSWALAYNTHNKPSAEDVGAAPSAHKHTANEVGALPIGGGTLTGNTFVDRGTGSEPQLGVSRDGRKMFMADNATVQGVYSASRAGNVPSWLVQRNIGDGCVTLGDDRSSTNINGKDVTFTYKGKKVYHEDFKPTPADLGAVPTSRTINGKPLTGDIVLTADDLGAGDFVGSVTKLMSVQDPLVTIGKKVYLKEGITLADADKLYPEAFALLTGKGGKQFNLFSPNQYKSGNVVGLFPRNNDLLIILQNSDRYELISFNPATRSWRLEKDFSGPDVRSNFVLSKGVMVASASNSKFVLIDLNTLEHVETTGPSGSFAAGSFGCATATRDGILFYCAENNDMAYVTLRDAKQIADMKIYTLPGQSGVVSCVASFADKTGNIVTIAATRTGQIMWKAGADHSTNAGWSVKSTAPAGFNFDPTMMVYSVAADVVYVGDTFGGYATFNPRVSSGVEYGAFFGEYENGLGWSCVNDVIFASPVASGNTDSSNHYYRLDPETRKWEAYKHGSDRRLGAIKMRPVAAILGETIVHVGGLATGVGSAFVMLISENTVHLSPDPSQKGAVSNYVRIK